MGEIWPKKCEQGRDGRDHLRRWGGLDPAAARTAHHVRGEVVIVEVGAILGTGSFQPQYGAGEVVAGTPVKNKLDKWSKEYGKKSSAESQEPEANRQAPRARAASAACC